MDERGGCCVELDGVRMDATAVVAAGQRRHVFLDGRALAVRLRRSASCFERGRGGYGNRLLAPMPGKVIALIAEAGQVDKGQPLLILEAMKMEHTITVRPTA